MQSVRKETYSDKKFTSKRAKSRREDAIALATGKASADEIQSRNSILTEDFWKEAQVNWESVAVGAQ